MGLKLSWLLFPDEAESSLLPAPTPPPLPSLSFGLGDEVMPSWETIAGGGDCGREAGGGDRKRLPELRRCRPRKADLRRPGLVGVGDRPPVTVTVVEGYIC